MAFTWYTGRMPAFTLMSVQAVGVAYGVNHGADVVVTDGILASEYLYAVVIDEGVGVLDGFHVVTREQFASMS